MVQSINTTGLFPEIIQLLTRNSIVVLPCDTIYGICGKAPDTASKIAEIKGRHPEKPFLMLIRSAEQIKDFSDFSIPPEIAEFWPGPLTLIIPGRDGQSYGFRVPQDDFLSQVLSAVDFPLFSTSVNRDGEAPLNNISDIVSQFEADVSLIVDGGEITNTQASTILNLCTRPFKILRQGMLSIPEDFLYL